MPNGMNLNLPENRPMMDDTGMPDYPALDGMFGEDLEMLEGVEDAVEEEFIDVNAPKTTRSKYDSRKIKGKDDYERHAIAKRIGSAFDVPILEQLFMDGKLDEETTTIIHDAGSLSATITNWEAGKKNKPTSKLIKGNY